MHVLVHDPSAESSQPCPVCETHLPPVKMMDKTWMMGFQKVNPLVGCPNCECIYVQSSYCNKAESYDDAYFVSFDVFKQDSQQNHARKQEFSRRLQFLESKCRGREILDIGCGNGDFLAMAQDRGWHCFGADISKYSQKRLLEKSIPLFVGDILLFLRDRHHLFDAIHLNHSLEHMANPLPVMRQAFLSLKAGGIIYVEVPNEFENLHYKIFEKIGRRREKGSIWGRSTRPYLHSPHLIYFNLKSLHHLALGSGFQQISIDARAKSDLIVDSAVDLLYRIGMVLNRGPFITLMARRINPDGK